MNSGDARRENRAFWLVFWLAFAFAITACGGMCWVTVKSIQRYTDAAIRREFQKFDRLAEYAQTQDAVLMDAGRKIKELERQNRLLGAYVEGERASLNKKALGIE